MRGSGKGGRGRRREEKNMGARDSSEKEGKLVAKVRVGGVLSMS